MLPQTEYFLALSIRGGRQPELLAVTAKHRFVGGYRIRSVVIDSLNRLSVPNHGRLFEMAET